MQDEVQLSSQQAALVARALYALSRIDGHEEREGMLIQSFWLEAVGSSQMHELQAFARETNFDPELLVKGLPGAEQRDVFIRTALMLCYADGKMSNNEKEWLWNVGARLSVSAEMLDGHDAAIRSYLLGQLVHVQNVDALREVAKELGLG